MPAFQLELSTALSAVREASKLCRSVQSSITADVLDKKDSSPVTVADFGSQAVICREIGNAFPSDPIIAEEDSAALHLPENTGFLEAVIREVKLLGIQGSSEDICGWIDRGGAHEASPRFWTLDPIDGTKGFLRHGQYAVSLALIINGRIELGVLGCPNLPCTEDENGAVGMLFYAVRGQGAFSVPLDIATEPQRVHVRSIQDPAVVRFCESVESGHSAHGDSAEVAKRLGITASPLRMDSQAKYATVARGFAEVYLRLPTKTGYFERIWDHAGGVVIVEEAGGRVTDVQGKELDFSLGRELKQNRGVIVTNGTIHDVVVETVKSVLSSSSAG